MCDLDYQDTDELSHPVPKLLLAKGTILYHGTNQPFEDCCLEFPAWFSQEIEVADQFKSWRNGTATPRILRWEVIEPITLAVFHTKQEIEMAFECLGFDIHYALDSSNNYEDINTVLRRHNAEGWIIPHNYVNGDDIVLLNGHKLQFLDCLDSEN